MSAAKPASAWPNGNLHAAQRRYLAEDLVRLRRSDEQRRYAAPQRAAKIDPNPHQVDAVIFALARFREGGCILADEVGLGKTIEAGLVMAQLLAEGASRILLIAPKPLLGQWRQELFSLFGIDAREGEARPGAFDGPGVFLIGREAAGSEKGCAALLDSGPFDLCVIDEAHEVFAGIYKRFDQYGEYKEEAPNARTAARVRDVLQAGQTPVILLTATPIQNSLTELWGLVQYVDPAGTLLGDLATFRELFCGEDDRQLAKGQEGELRRRLRSVLQRTLRRQAQEFLEKPFVQRHTKKFDYVMSPRERSLYEDVTQYLLEPGIVAFQGRHRHLLLTGFHRRMASSNRALAASLSRVATRLSRQLAAPASDTGPDDDARSMLLDLEDEEALEGASESVPQEAESAHNPEQVKAELARVLAFVERANGLAGEDSKFRALLQALTTVTERRDRDGKGSGKIVVFTESVETQEYLRERLVESKLVTNEDVTIFRGVNDSQRAREALARWQTEVPQNEGACPSRSVAVRLALVHEFRTRSKVFISTEAGAKGLNLQFCETVMNYDLPWNPQRIEQRIGRCHRYGQKHEVTVINFLAKDNEAEQLMFEILSQKLNLFGTVLDASDHVLHRPDDMAAETLVGVLGADVENALRRIWDRSRTLDEVHAELRALRDRVGEQRKRFEDGHARTASVIEEQLDAEVQRVFRGHKTALPGALAELDGDLLRVVEGYLQAVGISSSRQESAEGLLLHVGASPGLPASLRDGVTAALGAAAGHTSLHQGHPLVVAAVEEARASARGRLGVTVTVPETARASWGVGAGSVGRMRLLKVRYDGFERIERLVPVAVFGGNPEPLAEEDASQLLKGTIRTNENAGLGALPSDEVMDDAAEMVLFGLKTQIDGAEEQRFERSSLQAERFLDDRILVLRRRLQQLQKRLQGAELRQSTAVGADARTDAELAVLNASTEIEEVETKIGALERREDKTYQRYHDQLQARRYVVPEVERLFEMDVVLE